RTPGGRGVTRMGNRLLDEPDLHYTRAAARSSGKRPVKRLRPIDALLLALVVPVWGAWFSFQVYAAFADRTTWVPVNVAAARSAADHPTVTWVSPYWLGSGGLVVGD